jgi:YihY family inner membrane protein
VLFDLLPSNRFTRWDQYRRTGRYLLQTEVHVYAFSMAANVLLSFFPFLIVMVSLCRYVLGWHAAEQAIYVALSDYFPGSMGEFIQYNLKVTVAFRGPIQLGSMLLLLFTANGIFEPLEVALNRAWGIAKNRSYFRNQLVSLLLIFAVGGLALVSFMLTAVNQEVYRALGLATGPITIWINTAIFKMAAVPVTIACLLLTYWLLPNGKVSLIRLIPVSVVVAAALEMFKYVNLITWPFLRAKLTNEYGPFIHSVTIILWGFIASMIVLAGAEWAARCGDKLNQPHDEIAEASAVEAHL